jgi:hypothetical protein
MTPIEPPIPPNTIRIVFGEAQPEYIPLPAAVSPDGAVMTEWELSAEDLSTLLEGGRIRLWIWLHPGRCSKCKAILGPKLQPVMLEVVV